MEKGKGKGKGKVKSRETEKDKGVPYRSRLISLQLDDHMLRGPGEVGGNSLIRLFDTRYGKSHNHHTNESDAPYNNNTTNTDNCKAFSDIRSNLIIKSNNTVWSFNPAKAFSSMLNSANAGRLYASGMHKLAISAGFDVTGIGVPAGIGSALLGTWNIYSGTSAQKRAVKEWNEALNENWSDATWKNLLGVLPFGDKYDDPCEPTPFEFMVNQYDYLKNKPINMWEIIKEIGSLGF